MRGWRGGGWWVVLVVTQPSCRRCGLVLVLVAMCNGGQRAAAMGVGVIDVVVEWWVVLIVTWPSRRAAVGVGVEVGVGVGGRQATGDG